jgi:intein/homing endonuclease
MISRRYGIWKSTLYYHYRKIKGRRYALPNVIPRYSEIEGEIVGLFAGDGSQYFDRKRSHYEINVVFGKQNVAYALYVQNLFQAFFRKKFRLMDSGNGTLRLRTESKAIFHYFHYYLNYDSCIKHATVRLKEVALPRLFIVGFLRGLVDTDGSVWVDKKRNRLLIAFFSTSKRLATQILMLLDNLSLPASIYCNKRPLYKPLYTIRLRSHAMRDFLRIITPFKMRYVTEYLIK